MPRSRRLMLTTALGALALPLLTAAGPACNDPVAGAVHAAEETTGLHALHAVEEAYCSARP
jgi:hypothetical protein